jgi:hypothetical protein
MFFLSYLTDLVLRSFLPLFFSLFSFFIFLSSLASPFFWPLSASNNSSTFLLEVDLLDLTLTTVLLPARLLLAAVASRICLSASCHDLSPFAISYLQAMRSVIADFACLHILFEPDRRDKRHATWDGEVVD